MASKVEIWNMALGHLGQEEEVQDEAEDTSYANLCRRYWDDVLDEAFEDVNLPEARVRKVLALVENDPTDEWAFSYEYPSDCAYPRRILSARRDTIESRIPFQIVNDRDSGTLIYTDMEDAVLEYTLNETATAVYPASFRLMLSYKLAYMIAPKLTSGNPDGPALRNQAYELYHIQLSKARASSANKERRDAEPESEFTRNR
jgi:hypothetical protein